MARYSGTLGRWTRGETLTAAASAARAVTGDSGWLSSDEFGSAVLALDVTAASGTTPTLNVVVETASSNAGANTRAVTGSPFAQKTTSGAERKSFSGFDSFYRVGWTVGGTTPSFTFSVSGESK